MTFTKPWIAFPQDPDTKVPVLDVFLRTREGQKTREFFVVDSGADVSMAIPQILFALVCVAAFGASLLSGGGPHTLTDVGGTPLNLLIWSAQSRAMLCDLPAQP